MDADIFCIYIDQVLAPALAPATLSSSTIPAGTRSRAYARRPRPRLVYPPTTAPISTGSSRPSPSSKELLRKNAARTVSALVGSPALHLRNAPTISPTPDMFQSNRIRS